MLRLLPPHLALLAACSAGPLAPPTDPSLQPPAPPPDPAPLPGIRHGHRIEPIDGGWLAFGGFARSSSANDDDRGSRQTWFLPTGTDTWQRRADLHTGRAFAGSAVVRGAAFAIGDGVERYDPQTDRWTVIAPAGSLPRSHFGAAALGDRIFVLGGFPATGTGMWIVDADTGHVEGTPPPPTFRAGDHFHLLCAIAGDLHVLGGLDGESFTPRCEHWVRGGEGWQAMPAPPAGLWTKFAACAVSGNRLYVFGDAGGLCYEAVERTWTRRCPMPLALAMPCAVAAGDAVWVLGGLAVDGPRDVLLCYDANADRWRDLLPAR